MQEKADRIAAIGLKMVVKSGDPGAKATVADEGAFVRARGDLQRSGLLATVDEDLVDQARRGERIL